MPNNIQERLKFEPNKNALEAWLQTRKKKRVGHGYVIHGFFSTHSFVWDAILFVAGFSIELIIFGFFMSLVELNVLSNWIALPVIIVIDLLCVMLVHKNKAPKVKYENALLYLGEEDNPLIHDKKVINEEQLSSHLSLPKFNFLSYLGIALEFISCITKIFYLNAAYGLGIDPISIGIVVGYIFQTFCYINSAGYFMWEIIVSWFFIDAQYKKFKNSEGNDNNFIANRYELLFSSFINLKPTNQEQSGKATLFLELDNNYKNEGIGYKITCIGIPIDSDLIDFAAFQDTREAKKEIMSISHKLQLSKFSQQG